MRIQRLISKLQASLNQNMRLENQQIMLQLPLLRIELFIN